MPLKLKSISSQVDIKTLLLHTFHDLVLAIIHLMLLSQLLGLA